MNRAWTFRQLGAVAAAALTSLWSVPAAQGQVGACCMAEGSAPVCIEIAAQSCAEMGGVYLGAGTACATSECHAAQWMLVLDDKTMALELPRFDTMQQSRVLHSVGGRIDAGSTHAVALSVTPGRETCVTVEGSRIDVRVFVDAASEDITEWPMLTPLAVDSGFPWAPGPDDPLFCGAPGDDPMDPAICPADLGGPESCDYDSPIGYLGSDSFLSTDPNAIEPFIADGPQTFALLVNGDSAFIAYAILTQFSNPISEATGTVVIGYAYELLEGACCLPDGTCVLTTRPQCTAMQGTYAGDGTRCNQPNICAGACCLDDGCAVLTRDECLNQGGTFIAPGTDCEAPTECPAPCCLNDVCQIVPQDDCVQICGTYGAVGEECIQFCQELPPGACCLPDGSCESLCLDECEQMGGIYQGQGADCDLVTCPQPTSCPGDLNLDGRVDVFDLLDLLGQWGMCGDPCPPTCNADIAGDGPVATDCVVNVFDLLAVLGAWGECSD